jgi:hypothetical protein
MHSTFMTVAPTALRLANIRQMASALLDRHGRGLPISGSLLSTPKREAQSETKWIRRSELPPRKLGHKMREAREAKIPKIGSYNKHGSSRVKRIKLALFHQLFQPTPCGRNGRATLRRWHYFSRLMVVRCVPYEYAAGSSCCHRYYR